MSELPEALAARLRDAYEVLIATQTRLPEELWQALCERERRGVNVLIEHAFDAPYILQMLDAGFQVFEAKLQRADRIVLDREQVYTLPDWAPLPNAFSLGCKLARSRVGYYTRLRDTIASVTESQLMKLEEHKHLWLNGRGLESLPHVGERVTILANRSFLDSETPLLDVIRIWQAEGGLNGN